MNHDADNVALGYDSVDKGVSDRMAPVGFISMYGVTSYMLLAI